MAGNVDRVVAVLDRVAGEVGLPPARVFFPDAATALDLLEDAGFEIGREGVRTVAQRRSFTRDELSAFLRTQAVQAYPADDEGVRRRFLMRVEASLDELRRPDGSWDQTFVRLEVLVRRPA